MIGNMQSPFQWGSKGQKLTPEQVERERERAAAMLEGVGDTSPVQHWLQGAGRVVNAITGKIQDRRADSSEALGMESADNWIANNPVLSSLIGGGGSGVSMGVPQGAGQPLDAMNAAPVSPDQAVANDAMAAIGKAPLGGKLEGVDPRINEILTEAARRAGLNIGVSEGLRSEERQRQMVAQGKSQTMNSKHLHGGAADYHIIGDDGKPNWDFEAYRPLAAQAKLVAAEMGYDGFEWGGDWKSLKDGVHFQFRDGASATPAGQQAPQATQAGYTPPQGGGMPQMDNSVIAALSGAMSDPWVAKKYGPVIQALMGSQMKRQDMQYQQQLGQQDPMYQAKLAELTAPKPVDPWAGTQVINGQVVRMGANGPEAIGDFNKPEPGYQMVTPEEAQSLGLPPGAYQRGADGKVSQIGGNGTNVTVNTGSGPELGKLSSDYGYVLDPATGQPVIDPSTGLPTAAPVPGSPAARDIASTKAKSSESDRQSGIKMGTTLENIGLNIEELEDGGVPVTGLIGKMGRMIPGSQATDFANRTTQINTRAALDEVQNMRDNSPTGGAVGQLTDSEREAIGLAATSLADSSSKEEYLRSAKKFRELMLDTAHGEGNWRIDDKGQLIIGQGGESAEGGFDAFASDPSAQRAAEQYGVSLEEMWAIKQGQK